MNMIKGLLLIGVYVSFVNAMNKPDNNSSLQIGNKEIPVKFKGSCVIAKPRSSQHKTEINKDEEAICFKQEVSQK